MLQVNGKLRGKLRVPAGADAQVDRSGRARERRGREARGRRAGEEGDRRAGTARQCRGLNAWRAAPARSRRPRALARAPSASPAPVASRCRRIAGCGFHLRGDVTYAFSTLYVNSPANAPFTGELKRALAGSGSRRWSTAPPPRRSIFDVSGVTDDKQVLSLSGGGRVREYLLTKRVTFALHDAGGKDWLPAAEIVVRRSYTFSESEVLAREAEEARLLQGDADRRRAADRAATAGREEAGVDRRLRRSAPTGACARRYRTWNCA